MALDRRVVRTKGALTKALFELLGEKEFAKISVTELTRRADVDRKTFYLHYQCPEEIMEEFYCDQIQRVREQLGREGIFGQRVDIPGFFRVLNGVMSENLELYRHLANGPAYGAFQRGMQSLFRSVIINRLGPRCSLSAQELELYADFYAAGVLAVYEEWISGRMDISEAAVTQWVGDAITVGLRRAVTPRETGEQDRQ